MNHLRLLALLCLQTLALSISLKAQTYSIDWHVIGGGGGTGSGGTLSTTATAGQPDADSGVGGNLTLTTGFWSLFGSGPTATYGLGIAVFPSGSGAVTQDPNFFTYAPGAPVTLTAIPNAGWMFTGWSFDASGTENPLTVTMTGNKSITANFQPSLVVANTNDNGPGSLRQAITDAPGTSGKTITFTPGFAGTILLTNGGLSIGSDMTIFGPGANLLTIDGSGTNRVLAITAGSVNLSGLTLAHGPGGIVSSNAAVSVRDCVIAGNIARGVYNGTNGTMILNGCTIASNAVSGFGPKGGGIQNATSTSTLAMTNCTVSSNSCIATLSGNALGGGIESVGPLTLISCTICSNLVGKTQTVGLTEGGGVSASSLRIGNCIIAGNSSANLYGPNNAANLGPDVATMAALSLGYNLIGITNGSTGWQSSDLTGSATNLLDAKLGPLQNNGGTTLTHALPTGSPALDAGKSFGLTTDQRGQTRPFDDPAIPNAPGGDGSDIGAYEAFRFIPPSLVIQLTATNTVVVSWPSPSTGFVLQQNSSPSSSAGWSNFGGVVADDGIVKNVIISLPSATVYYRLKQ